MVKGMDKRIIVREQLEEAQKEQIAVHIVANSGFRKSIFTATKIIQIGKENFVFLDKFGMRTVLLFSDVVQLNQMANYGKKTEMNDKMNGDMNGY